jgi:hypothetical protein
MLSWALVTVVTGFSYVPKLLPGTGEQMDKAPMLLEAFIVVDHEKQMK